MKKVYDCKQFIVRSKSEKASLEETSIWAHYHLMSDEEVAEYNRHIICENFEDLCQKVDAGEIRNASTYYNFQQKKTVCIHCGIDIYRITKRNFKWIGIFNKAEPVPNATIDDLSQRLLADEFCEYLRERNVPYVIK